MPAEELFRRVADDGPGPWWLGALRGLARGASWLYGLGVGARNAAYDLGLARVERLPLPVVGVGGLSVGGSGKTPVVAALARACLRLGLPVAVVSRGYGGRGGGGVRWVSRGGELLSGPAEAGDEPVLLARRLPGVPVAVGADRTAVGRAVWAACGPRVLVGDDLFQHRRLHRELDLLCLDAARPLGNGFLLPRGELREPAGSLRRAQAVVLTRAEDRECVERARRWLRSAWGPGPVLVSRHRIAGLEDAAGHLLPEQSWRGRRVLAFCGLARPEGFFRALEGLGLSLVGREGFGDHHRFTPGELAELWREAGRLGAAALVTSEKDAVRLPAALPEGPPLWVTRLELEFEGGSEVLARLLLWGLRAWSGGS